jgi:ornithine cyclodeaminase/alanine dehydrogenase-like protein (mu-crystallin family)
LAWFVGRTDVERLFAVGHVALGECIDAVEAAFREHGRDAVGILPRQILTADGAPPQPRSRTLKLSASYMRETKLMGASIYSTHFRSGDVDMWLLVFSGESGDLEGILHGKSLSLWKTGATAAVAARHMARRLAGRAALIGTGVYAKAQLQCLVAARALTDIACYSRDAARLHEFVAWASAAAPPVRVTAAASAQHAVDGADIVVTITTSPTPVVQGAWLGAGTHCNVMGQHAPATREVDSAAIVRSRVIVDAREKAFAEKGEILIPLRAGEIGDAHVAGELGEVVAGRIAGRTHDDEITVFCSGGTALEYMHLCRLLVARAQAAGLGHALD